MEEHRISLHHSLKAKRYGKCRVCGNDTYYYWMSNKALLTRLGMKLATRAIALRQQTVPGFYKENPTEAPPAAS